VPQRASNALVNAAIERAVDVLTQVESILEDGFGAGLFEFAREKLRR
jgi:hypothetical protein